MPVSISPAVLADVCHLQATKVVVQCWTAAAFTLCARRAAVWRCLHQQVLTAVVGDWSVPDAENLLPVKHVCANLWVSYKALPRGASYLERTCVWSPPSRELLFWINMTCRNSTWGSELFVVFKRRECKLSEVLCEWQLDVQQTLWRAKDEPLPLHYFIHFQWMNLKTACLGIYNITS